MIFPKHVTAKPELKNCCEYSWCSHWHCWKKSNAASIRIQPEFVCTIFESSRNATSVHPSFFFKFISVITVHAVYALCIKDLRSLIGCRVIYSRSGGSITPVFPSNGICIAVLTYFTTDKLIFYHAWSLPELRGILNVEFWKDWSLRCAKCDSISRLSKMVFQLSCYVVLFAVDLSLGEIHGFQQKCSQRSAKKLRTLCKKNEIVLDVKC